MCRIFGMSFHNDSREDLDPIEIAGVLYPALIHQGPHSWGWMSYNAEDGGIISAKHPGRADTDEAWDVMNDEMDPDCNWMVGHLRYATHGSPQDNRNNHPVSHGSIIGVHNGVLRNHEKILAKTGREDPKTKVDSEAIFAAVNRWGAKKGLAKIDGDMVTIYSDRRRPHVLHIGRSHGRQLTIGWTEKGNLIFASEEQALRQLAPEIKFRKFSTISENRLLVIRNGKIITRLTFAPPRPRYVAPPRSISVPRRPAVTRERETFGTLNAERANRRGELIFGKRDPVVSSGKKKGRGDRMTPPDLSDKHLAVEAPDGGESLFYYRGELLTRSEYQEVIESESRF